MLLIAYCDDDSHMYNSMCVSLCISCLFSKIEINSLYCFKDSKTETLKAFFPFKYFVVLFSVFFFEQYANYVKYFIFVSIPPTIHPPPSS